MMKNIVKKIKFIFMSNDEKWQLLTKAGLRHVLCVGDDDENFLNFTFKSIKKSIEQGDEVIVIGKNINDKILKSLNVLPTLLSLDSKKRLSDRINGRPYMVVNVRPGQEVIVQSFSNDLHVYAEEIINGEYGVPCKHVKKKVFFINVTTELIGNQEENKKHSIGTLLAKLHTIGWCVNIMETHKRINNLPTDSLNELMANIHSVAISSTEKHVDDRRMTELLSLRHQDTGVSKRKPSKGKTIVYQATNKNTLVYSLSNH